MYYNHIIDKLNEYTKYIKLPNFLIICLFESYLITNTLLTAEYYSL